MQFLIAMLVPSPTSLDVYFAAHILLLTDPPFHDAVLQVQLCESYPGLVEHAQRIQEAAKRAPPYEISTASESLLSFSVPRSFSSSDAQTQVDPADIQYRRRTLVFLIGTLAMAAVYIYMNVFINLAEDSETDNEDGESEVHDSDEGEGEGGEEEELAGGSGAFTDEDEDQ